MHSNEGLAFFFNKDNIKICNETLSKEMPLTPAECGSSTHTGITC